MGVLESIDNSLSLMSQSIIILEKRMSEIESNNETDSTIIMKFEEDDNLNISFASKFLNLTKPKIISLVKNGELETVGDTKYIFKVSELLRFKKEFSEDKRTKIPQREKKNQNKRVKIVIASKSDEVINKDDFAELASIN